MIPILPRKSYADGGQNGDIGIRTASCRRLSFKRGFAAPSREACAEALRSRPHHSLDHHSLFLCSSPDRHRDFNISSPVLLGRDRHRLDEPVVSTTDPFLKKISAHCLRLRAAGPERLEPSIAL